MKTRDIVILVTLGATLSMGGRTLATKIGSGTVTAAHASVKAGKKTAHVAVKPFIWAARRVVK
jgi:hypothetical protein